MLFQDPSVAPSVPVKSICAERRFLASASKLAAVSGMSQSADVGRCRLKSGLCCVLVVVFGARFPHLSQENTHTFLTDWGI